jgi:DNA-binding transcriptional LysR family regulator
MHTLAMTLVQLRHFIALVEHGSFVKASQALFLTQPALTRSIRALEDDLGGALLDRLGRRVVLTALGQEVLQRARRLVGEAEALRQTGRQLHQGLMGTLRIGFSSAPGALFSTPLLAHMAHHHPRLHVHISRGSTAVLLHELQDERLDAALVDVRSMRPDPGLDIAQAFDLEAGFLARPGHPLAVTGAEVSFNALLAYPIASTPLSDEVARRLVARYGPKAHPQELVTLRCDETLSIIELARGSDAIVLTVRALASDLEPLNVAPSLDVTARLGLVTLAGRQLAPALRIVNEQLALWISALR